MEKKLLFILLSVFLTLSGHAQVTIGSQIKTQEGSLLDLKANDNLGVNAFGGLLMPRVNLTDINNLYPMFGVANNIDADYNTDTKKEEQDLLHTGLVVFNINTIIPKICPGIYVWSGTDWQRLPEPCYKDPNFEIELEGQSCGFTGRTLTYTSSLIGDASNVVIDRWTITKEGGAEQVISGETSAVLNYEFPLSTTTEGKYSFTVYYKHITGEEKSKTITTEIYHSILSDFIVTSLSGTRRYQFSTTAHIRMPGHEYGTTTNTPFVKWTYIKEGTTEEVVMDSSGSKTITYSFPSTGTYYYRMYWVFPCEEGLDPTPADFSETPRATLHPLVVGKLNVR